jgi:hypothetical protein
MSDLARAMAPHVYELEHQIALLKAKAALDDHVLEPFRRITRFNRERKSEWDRAKSYVSARSYSAWQDRMALSNGAARAQLKSVLLQMADQTQQVRDSAQPGSDRYFAAEKRFLDLMGRVRAL